MNKVITVRVVPNEFFTVTKIAKMYNVSPWSIYEAIKTDASFPFHNVGPKKNYRINPVEFRSWLKKKSQLTQYKLANFKTAEELLKGHHAKS